MDPIEEKARHEKAVGEGWFAGSYTSKEAVELVAEMQGLDIESIEYFYNKKRKLKGFYE